MTQKKIEGKTTARGQLQKRVGRVETVVSHGTRMRKLRRGQIGGSGSGSGSGHGSEWGRYSQGLRKQFRSGHANVSGKIRRGSGRGKIYHGSGRGKIYHGSGRGKIYRGSGRGKHDRGQDDHGQHDHGRVHQLQQQRNPCGRRLPRKLRRHRRPSPPTRQPRQLEPSHRR